MAALAIRSGIYRGVSRGVDSAFEVRKLFTGGGGGGAGISRWKTLAAGKTGRVTFWGDSTTLLALNMWSLIDSQIKTVGGEMDGVTFTNLGLNGETMLGATTAEVIATSPDLIVLCFGINDVRTGGVDAATLQARIASKVATVRAALPGCDWVLWTPNSLLSTDPSSSGFVTPLGSAQAYTDVMWNAYNNLVGQYTNTIHVDKMQIFGRTCPATSALMNDILHPSNAGQLAAFEALLPLIQPDPVAINLTASAAAWTSNPTNPWTVYARALEDTRYCTALQTLYISATDNVNYADMGSRHANSPALSGIPVQTGDWIKTPGGVYTATGFEGWTGVRLYTLGPTWPASNGTGNAVVYRHL